jgi:citrate synthase
MDKSKEGLQDIVALDSEICFLDGKNAVLAYRGYNINDLSEQEITSCKRAR